MSAPTYYKALRADGKPIYGTGTWHLPPDGDTPGEWMPEITGLKPCRRGYHVATLDQLIGHLGPTLWVAECRGEHIDAGHMHVFGQARLLRRVEAWNERTQRLLAAEFAEHVLYLFEAELPGDDRPRRAIEVARGFAMGYVTGDELAAARAAAWAAAGNAASDAVRDAARAAARLAARKAARAAWAAASDAARNPAGNAASDAAWAAAWAAARAAVRAAARDAARDAERRWQTERLAQLIDQETAP